MLISCMVTTQLICVFVFVYVVFAYAKSHVSHYSAHQMVIPLLLFEQVAKVLSKLMLVPHRIVMDLILIVDVFLEDG